MGYRIKTVSDMLGVPRNTLLAWERRYSLVTPARQSNGYREYSEADVTKLREVKRLIDEGHKVSEAISMLQISAQRAALRDVDQPVLSHISEQLMSALLTYDRTMADRLVQRLSAVSYRQQIEDVYFPMLRAVGEGWCNGEISITQEHYISGFCREQLVAMLLSMECGPRHGPLAVCAGYPGERHDMGLLALAVLLALRGKRILFLGADVPLEELCTLVAEQNPEMTCVSVMMPHNPDELASFARRLNEVSPNRVVIGGRGLPADLPKIMGVEWHRTMDALA
ncbi:MAG: MerR family transcriptional regulator [Myxococcota bacterium]